MRPPPRDPYAVDRAYHDSIASEYDAVVVEPRGPANDLLFKPLLAPLRGAEALDLGCGTGHMTLRLAPRFARITAVDHSPGMLAQARRKAQATGHPHIDFVEADAAEFLAASSQRWPVITAVGFLHHVVPAQLGELLAALRDHMAPGGALVIAEPFAVDAEVPPAIAAWNARSPLLQRDYREAAPDPDEAPLDETAFRALLGRLGLEVDAEQRCWEVFAHHARPGPLERWRLGRLFRRFRGQGNVIAMRLRAADPGLR